MPKYVCSELSSPDVNGFQHCLAWLEYSSSLDMLAITQSQADQISTALLTVIIGAWAIRQVHNAILRRRY